MTIPIHFDFKAQQISNLPAGPSPMFHVGPHVVPWTMDVDALGTAANVHGVAQDLRYEIGEIGYTKTAIYNQDFNTGVALTAGWQFGEVVTLAAPLNFCRFEVKFSTGDGAGIFMGNIFNVAAGIPAGPALYSVGPAWMEYTTTEYWMEFVFANITAPIVFAPGQYAFTVQVLALPVLPALEWRAAAGGIGGFVSDTGAGWAATVTDDLAMIIYNEPLAFTPVYQNAIAWNDPKGFKELDTTPLVASITGPALVGFRERAGLGGATITELSGDMNLDASLILDSGEASCYRLGWNLDSVGKFASNNWGATDSDVLAADYIVGNDLGLATFWPDYAVVFINMLAHSDIVVHIYLLDGSGLPIGDPLASSEIVSVNAGIQWISCRFYLEETLPVGHYGIAVQCISSTPTIYFKDYGVPQLTTCFYSNDNGTTWSQPYSNQWVLGLFYFEHQVGVYKDSLRILSLPRTLYGISKGWYDNDLLLDGQVAIDYKLPGTSEFETLQTITIEAGQPYVADFTLATPKVFPAGTLFGFRDNMYQQIFSPGVIKWAEFALWFVD